MKLQASYARTERLSRAAVARAIAARLAAAGWRFRRGSTAPWIEPGADDDSAGYSLLGAAARQAELEGATQQFERHSDG